jgi:hypothetical protein
MGAVQKRQKRELPLARAAILLHPPFVATLRVSVALSHACMHSTTAPPLPTTTAQSPLSTIIARVAVAASAVVAATVKKGRARPASASDAGTGAT